MDSETFPRSIAPGSRSRASGADLRDPKSPPSRPRIQLTPDPDPGESDRALDSVCVVVDITPLVLEIRVNRVAIPSSLGHGLIVSHADGDVDDGSRQSSLAFPFVSSPSVPKMPAPMAHAPKTPRAPSDHASSCRRRHRHCPRCGTARPRAWWRATIRLGGDAARERTREDRVKGTGGADPRWSRQAPRFDRRAIPNAPDPRSPRAPP